MRRGRSVRSEVGLGLDGEKGSFGHAYAVLAVLKVGCEKAAEFVYRVNR